MPPETRPRAGCRRGMGASQWCWRRGREAGSCPPPQASQGPLLAPVATEAGAGAACSWILRSAARLAAFRPRRHRDAAEAPAQVSRKHSTPVLALQWPLPQQVVAAAGLRELRAGHNGPGRETGAGAVSEAALARSFRAQPPVHGEAEATRRARCHHHQGCLPLFCLAPPSPGLAARAAHTGTAVQSAAPPQSAGERQLPSVRQGASLFLQE